MKAYWFSRKDGTTEYQKTPARIGRTDECTGDIVPCQNGLHGSPTPWDALRYASGPLLWEVELTGETIAHGDPIDKYAARSRTYLRSVDASQVLRAFACRQALGVISLWDAPVVVREYLESIVGGHERAELRAAAWAAARDAARAAAGDAARAAARAAARDAAWAAAGDAARAAARAAAGDAAKKMFNKMCEAGLSKQEVNSEEKRGTDQGGDR